MANFQKRKNPLAPIATKSERIVAERRRYTVKREMVSDFAKRIGLAHKIISAGEAAGFTPAEWNELAEDPIRFKELHDMRVGIAVIRKMDYIIDFNANPFVPFGLSVEEHQKGGKWMWNPDQIELLLFDWQKRGGGYEGWHVRKILAGRPVLNANVADFLFERPYLFPEKLKEETNCHATEIFFWGTIYISLHNGLCANLYVRSLCWNEGKLKQDYRSLRSVFGPTAPVAMRKLS